ncbi:MAG TPA: TIGR04282 family arsenosugar biosynthesis glycosyltransferase [Solirubrobacteraceae bacterium]|nr:TIGR04282 family arsenosugar biosynthesis glycosyltransferase [Solirubrobacteraceae bacterium]
MESVALLVIAKEPVPGRVKTRLTPPCTPAQAARLADAALRDTLDAIAETPAARKVLVFEGNPSAYVQNHEGLEVIPQRGHGLAERLAAAFEDVGQPALLVGMDTPQLTPALLTQGIGSLHSEDAVLGPTLDGGYWCIGLTKPNTTVFTGVPMSSHSTCIRQRTRLHHLGLRTHELPLLRDVDTIEDAHAVAALAPASRFAEAVAATRARPRPRTHGPRPA